MRSQLLDPVDDPRWRTLVENSPQANIFHHPLWLGLLRDCYRYPMTAVCLTDGQGAPVAGLPIATVSSRFTGERLVSVPFSDLCAPVAGSPADHEALMAAVEAERTRRGLPLELHSEVHGLTGAGPSDRFYRHVVQLAGGTEAVMKRVKQPKRRGAARAREFGVTVDRCADSGAIDAFFRLQVLTRRRLGIPTQPRRFFRRLPELFEQGLGFILLARWNDRPIAANVYLRHRSMLTYKYGASDPAFLDKRPNDLLHLDGLRLACEMGCSVVDLGRTELDNDGLRRFKRQLGADETELSYTMVPQQADRKSVRSVSQLQRTLIRRSPPAFGRLLGAGLYRHFG